MNYSLTENVILMDLIRALIRLGFYQTHASYISNLESSDLGLGSASNPDWTQALQT